MESGVAPPRQQWSLEVAFVVAFEDHIQNCVQGVLCQPPWGASH